MLSQFSHLQFFVTLWTVSWQFPLSMGFSRQEYWNGWPCPPPGNLPNLGIKPTFPVSTALAGRFFTYWATWEAQPMIQVNSPSTLWSVNICSVLFPNKPSSISTGARELNIYSYFSTQYVFLCVCVCGGVCVCVCVCACVVEILEGHCSLSALICVLQMFPSLLTPYTCSWTNKDRGDCDKRLG